MNTTSSPILTKRPANERGQADHGWLQAQFTFSFSEYFNPDHMGFHTLRVMNNDTVQPGGGFPRHPHSDMEIFTYVIEGELEHKDSMGNGAIIKAGDLQYMSAGSGVFHSEFNPSTTKKAQLYQVWITPNEKGGEPRYSEKPLGEEAPPNTLELLFSVDGRDGSTAIRQDAEIYFGRVDGDHTLTVPAAAATPHAWVQVIEGEVSVLGETLNKGDGLAIEHGEGAFEIKGNAEAKLLVFRLG
jgi:redox-sensitive bicupin YhaK (pirin superfamily)